MHWLNSTHLNQRKDKYLNNKRIIVLENINIYTWTKRAQHPIISAAVPTPSLTNPFDELELLAEVEQNLWQRLVTAILVKRNIKQSTIQKGTNERNIKWST